MPSAGRRGEADPTPSPPACGLPMLVVPALLLSGIALPAQAPPGPGPPGPTAASADTAPPLHATLRGWVEGRWAMLEDRGAAAGGRLSPDGILRRFHPGIDAEYRLDLVSSRFGLADDHRWYRRAGDAGGGVRYWAGSINQRVLTTGAEARATVPVDSAWSLGVGYRRRESPVVDRGLLHLRVRRAWEGGVTGYVEGSLHADKPDSDVTVGARWDGGRTRAAVAVTLLDAFSDVIYQGLVVWHGFAPVATDYERHPVALRASAEHAFGADGEGVRLEAHGAWMRPARVRAYRQTAPDSGFVQDERFSLAAGLVEAPVAAGVRAGVFASRVRAELDREPLPAGPASDDFRLVERTTRAGAFVLARAGASLEVEGRVAREWRPELRERPATAPDSLPGVDYEDRAWIGRLGGSLAVGAGFDAVAAVEWDLRDVVRGAGQVPATDSFDQDNTRLNLGVGWSPGPAAELLLGYRLDLDGDPGTGHGSFDGAHGRFALRW